MPSPEIKLSTDSRGVATISFQGIKSLNIVGSAEVEGLPAIILFVPSDFGELPKLELADFGRR